MTKSKHEFAQMRFFLNLLNNKIMPTNWNNRKEILLKRELHIRDNYASFALIFVAHKF